MPKLQRWLDLLAALLARRYPVTLEQLVADVPGYQRGQTKVALRRTFERDKDELRRFGVEIETVRLPDEEGDGYRLAARSFYLPYLALMNDGRAVPPKRPTKPGYAALPMLVFE